jgi:hypothetical protein
MFCCNTNDATKNDVDDLVKKRDMVIQWYMLHMKRSEMCVYMKGRKTRQPHLHLSCGYTPT